MSEHLTSLALDELAVGEPNAAAAAHVKECGQCRARLDQVMAANDAVLGSQAFLQRLEVLERSQTPSHVVPAAAPTPSRRVWPRLVAVALPLAAALAVFFLVPRDEGTRLKGRPTVEVLSEAGQVVTAARPGDRVTLAVGGAGQTHALVFAVEATGEVTKVWPTGPDAAPIPKGARARLDPAFTVTPGSLVLFAFFSEGPRPAAPLVEALERGVADAVRSGRVPLEMEAPEGFVPVARARLEVAP